MQSHASGCNTEIVGNQQCKTQCPLVEKLSEKKIDQQYNLKKSTITVQTQSQINWNSIRSFKFNVTQAELIKWARHQIIRGIKHCVFECRYYLQNRCSVAYVRVCIHRINLIANRAKSIHYSWGNASVKMHQLGPLISGRKINRWSYLDNRQQILTEDTCNIELCRNHRCDELSF